MRRLTTEEFIEKAIKVHGGMYDYSLVKYIKSIEKVKILCKHHGVFDQTPNAHLSGSGCRKCSEESQIKTRDFVVLARLTHGETYDYSRSMYINNATPLIITCKIHGDFLQDPSSHYKGSGCRECWKIKMSGIRSNTNEWIKSAIDIHGDKYDYSRSKYTGSGNDILIICKKHGEFLQRASSHLFGSGCKKCKTSKGERLISETLTELGVKFNAEYSFANCKDKRELPLDFYLPELNTCIEYDGQQHYRPVRFGGMSYEDALRNYCMTKNRDRLKTEYCKENEIRLIRIPYFEFKNIETILKKELTLD